MILYITFEKTIFYIILFLTSRISVFFPGKKFTVILFVSASANFGICAVLDLKKGHLLKLNCTVHIHPRMYAFYPQQVYHFLDPTRHDSAKAKFSTSLKTKRITVNMYDNRHVFMNSFSIHDFVNSMSRGQFFITTLKSSSFLAHSFWRS